MPPTAFAEVRRRLDLAREADEAIDRLLAIKENAREKERTVPETALLPLVLWRDTRGANRQTTSPPHAPTSSESSARLPAHDIKFRG